MGKPYKQSLKEVTSMIQVSKSLSTQAEHSLASEIIEDSESGYKKIIKEPIGPVFLLSPYNYPLLSVIGSLVPAILSGNPVIIKPSPYTPLSAKRFSAAFKEAGNELLVQDSLLHTKDISQILQNPNINYVHLVGHSETGRTLYREIAHKSFIDIGLFLSSNNGVYVSDDCNIGSAVLQIIKSSMDNSGQSSYRYSRVFVHKSKYEEFLSTAEPLIMSYSIGDPMDEATSLGPITEPDTIDLLAKSLEDAASAGGQIVCGGNAVNDENGKGRFFEPTLLTGVDDSFPIMV
jgi:acyl-CoA reductase-like NAD-dependent aldehyde dehydrogenase